MALEKFVWNNGTKDNPIVLTQNQITKLINIHDIPNLTTEISGYINTTSKTITGTQYYKLKRLFPNLTVLAKISFEEFLLSLPSVIYEDSITDINITTIHNITINDITTEIESLSFVESAGDYENDIKNRIRIENNKLIVESPKENVSWKLNAIIIAYPKYYENKELVPSNEIVRKTVSIVGVAITDFNITTDKTTFSIGKYATLNINLVPSHSTKKSAINFEFFVQGDRTIEIIKNNNIIKAKAISSGTTELIIRGNAFDAGFIKQKQLFLTTYDGRPTRFIIDQRGTISDPDGMISSNYILEDDGTLTEISANGKEGDIKNNAITRIRANSHCYVTKDLGETMRIKQLSDSTRKRFADDSDASGYIQDEAGMYDVVMKFGSDIYFKSEPWTPPNNVTKNNDYVMISIADELPDGENPNDWKKWNEYDFIAVYRTTNINNIPRSISNHKPNGLSQENYIENRINVSKYNYKLRCLLTILFWGYYRTTNNSVCGKGTIVKSKNTPKITGLNDNLAMTDTNTNTGTGLNPTDDEINAGYGDNIKSVNFWGLEGLWGDIATGIVDVGSLSRNNIINNNIDISNIPIYDINGNITIYKSTKDYTDTLKDNYISYFIYENNKIARILSTNVTANNQQVPKTLHFNTNCDIIFKTIGNYGLHYINQWSQNNNQRDGRTCGQLNNSSGGENVQGYGGLIAITEVSDYNTSYRLIFNRTEDNIEIVKNGETL